MSRILIYFADSHRNIDYRNYPENPYRKFLESLKTKFRVSVLDNYYSEYCSTYRWFLSFINGRTELDNAGFDIRKARGNEFIPCNSFILPMIAKGLGYNFRVSEIARPGYESKEWDYFNVLPKDSTFHRLGNFASRYMIKNDFKDNQIDFIYDIGYHWRIYDSKNTIEDMPKLMQESFDYSSEILNKDTISRYDYVLFVADHGHSDVINGSLVQHDVNGHLGYGSPYHHTNPVCYILQPGKGIEYSDSLINQVDLFNIVRIWLNEGKVDINLFNRPFIVTHGYNIFDKGYPRYYHIVYSDKYISIDSKAIFANNNMNVYASALHDQVLVPYALTKEDWNILYQTSPYFSKLFDYEEFEYED